MRTMLDDLDEYSLGHVFLFLSVHDLDRCIMVCRKFKQIIHQHVYPKKCLHSLVTGAEISRNLSLRHFTPRKLIKLDENWLNGRYEERTYFNHSIMYISRMLIDKDWFYMTHGGRLQAHKRTKDKNVIDTNINWMVGSARDSDITSLVKEDRCFFAGRMDGKIMFYDDSIQQQYLLPITDDVIKAVDMKKDIYVVTTKTQSTYTFNCSSEALENLNENGRSILCSMISYPEPYETLKINCNKVAAGKFHCSKKKALHLIDLCSWNISKLNSSTMAVYDVTWKDESCILSGNFDTTLRLTDIRTGNDEACWVDPYDASVYCVYYNGTNAVHCGMKYHYRSNLYDLRMPNRCIQMYFPSRKNNNFSPVYGIAADCSLLFLITDHDLRILNFDADWARSKNYASL